MDRDDNGNISNVQTEIPLSSDIKLVSPPLKPTDDGWEDQMKARLKRLVVERCLFGVDLNGMAVELSQLSLWLETMDKELPFEFLDHRIKQGNSLLGTWFCNYQNYPAKAWERQDGTGKDKNNKAILREIIKPELVKMITQPEQYSILEEGELPAVILNRQMQFWKELERTQLFDTEKREEIYNQKIENDPNFIRLKHQFDRWCVTWFWPSEDESKPTLSPMNLFKEDDKLSDIVRDLKANLHFFHWELEFPEVFIKDNGNQETGFDAILGNPPWDIQKPNSKEFFSNFDPIYRTYGKQEALRKQRQMFEESHDIESQWQGYNGFFKSMSNYVRNAHNPYDVTLARGRTNDELKQSWKFIRDKKLIQHCSESPFEIQGGADLNLYKLILEQSFHLLKNAGRLGMIIPSGIYTDKGSMNLRFTFLDQANWEWLFAFENRMKLFDIHSRFKFGPIVITKGGKTDSVKCAFMRHDVKDWESKDPPYLKVPVVKIERFSPNTMSFMEFKSDLDMQICDKIYGDRPLLGDQFEGGWNVKFAREFDMTNDSYLFTSRKKLENQGLIHPDKDTRDPRVRISLWKEGFVFIIEGKHIHQFTATWSEPRVPISIIELEKYYSKGKRNINQLYSSKVIIRQISASTNMRTSIATFVNGSTTTAFSTRVIYIDQSDVGLCVSTYFNTFIADWLLRLTGNMNLTTTLLNIPVPCSYQDFEQSVLERTQTMYSELYCYSNLHSTSQKRLLKKIELDCIVAEMFELSVDEFNSILQTFPLVDKTLPIERRQTSLTFEAFKHLKKVGLEQFLSEGWELPDYVTEFDRPGIKIWEPEGGWKQAWAEAKAMLTEEECKEFSGQVSVDSDSEQETDHETSRQWRPKVKLVRQEVLDMAEPFFSSEKNLQDPKELGSSSSSVEDELLKMARESRRIKDYRASGGALWMHIKIPANVRGWQFSKSKHGDGYWTRKSGNAKDLVKSFLKECILQAGEDKVKDAVMEGQQWII